MPRRAARRPTPHTRSLEGASRPVPDLALARSLSIRSPDKEQPCGRARPGRVTRQGDSQLRQRGTAESELVAVGVAVRGLADAVRVGLSLRRAESSLGDLRHARLEVVDEDQVPGMPGVLWPLLD